MLTELRTFDAGEAFFWVLLYKHKPIARWQSKPSVTQIYAALLKLIETGEY